MKGLVCFKCKKSIETNDYRMVGLDKPYVNLFYHTDCFMESGGYDKICLYLAENPKMVYDSVSKSQERTKK